MTEEQKPAAVPANTNAEAEKDVQNVLAELKAGNAGEEKKASEQGGAEKKDGENAEEARIVSEAAKLGEKSEKAEESAESKKPESESCRGGRTNYRNNIKFDPSTQKETDDPVEIRKQVSQTASGLRPIPRVASQS